MNNKSVLVLCTRLSSRGRELEIVVGGGRNRSSLSYRYGRLRTGVRLFFGNQITLGAMRDRNESGKARSLTPVLKLQVQPSLRPHRSARA
jgi:hypothetical protein